MKEHDYYESLYNDSQAQFNTYMTYFLFYLFVVMIFIFIFFSCLIIGTDFIEFCWYLQLLL